MPWAVVEKLDEDGELRTHIVPVRTVLGFKTEGHAIAFVQKCEEAGNPVLTGDEDIVTATHFGHTISPSCICLPRQSEADSGLYIHREAN